MTNSTLLTTIGSAFNITTFATLSLILLAIVWSIAWKAFALWQCARNNQKWWFIAVAVINTLGILEIIYLLFFKEDKNNELEIGEAGDQTV